MCKYIFIYTYLHEKLYPAHFTGFLSQASTSPINFAHLSTVVLYSPFHVFLSISSPFTLVELRHLPTEPHSSSTM